MRYEVTAEYSESLVRTASRRFLIKFFGWDLLVAWLVGLALLLALGAYGWLTGLFGTLLVLTTILVVAFPIAYYRRGLALLRKMKTPRVQWVFDDAGISVSPICPREAFNGRWSRDCGAFLRWGCSS
jgi:hypothetical protein